MGIGNQNQNNDIGNKWISNILGGQGFTPGDLQGGSGSNTPPKRDLEASGITGSGGARQALVGAATQ